MGWFEEILQRAKSPSVSLGFFGQAVDAAQPVHRTEGIADAEHRLGAAKEQESVPWHGPADTFEHFGLGCFIEVN